MTSDQESLKAAVFQRLHPRIYLERFVAENVRPDGRDFDGWRDVSVNVGMLWTVSEWLYRIINLVYRFDHNCKRVCPRANGRHYDRMWCQSWDRGTRTRSSRRRFLGYSAISVKMKRGSFFWCWIFQWQTWICPPYAHRNSSLVHLQKRLKCYQIVWMKLFLGMMECVCLFTFSIDPWDSSGTISTKSLCIQPGKSVWVLYVDATCVNYDGNAFDATLLATIAALKNSRSIVFIFAKRYRRASLQHDYLKQSITRRRLKRFVLVKRLFP